MNDYIPDPIEQLNNRIENQIDLVDENNTYPCYYCGKRFDIDTMTTISPDPDSPLCCKHCIKVTFKCKKDFFMYEGLKVFTKNEKYIGQESYFCWIFKNDQNKTHYLAQRHLDEYFEIMKKND